MFKNIKRKKLKLDMMTETVVTVEQPTRNGAQPNIPPKSGNALSFLQFNINYFTTIPGFIKIAQLVGVFLIFYQLFFL